MLGFFFTEIRQYVRDNMGESGWVEVMEHAGLGLKDYMNGLDYPDKEMVAIMVSAANLSGAPLGHFLKGFGFFLGGHLFNAFKPLINPHWRTLDFYENVEETIHQVVRARNRKARPPQLLCTRITSRELFIDYRSERKLCQLAQGIALGVAGHYGEEVEILEETCMHRGDPSCKIWIALGKKPEIKKISEDDIWSDS